MPQKNPPFFRYRAHSKAHLERARRLLAIFDENADAASLFYAVLELRFDIEQRLYEYIDAEMRDLDLGKTPVPEYVATRLLRKLESLNPDTAFPVELSFLSETNNRSFSLYYTPVRPSLASAHGKLGELLHAKFFRKNKYWNIRDRLGSRNHKSLADFRVFLDDVVIDLEYSTSGTLLNHVTFRNLVSESLDEGSSGESS